MFLSNQNKQKIVNTDKTGLPGKRKLSRQHKTNLIDERRRIKVIGMPTINLYKINNPLCMHERTQSSLAVVGLNYSLCVRSDA
jgi:hypothetical protein